MARPKKAEGAVIPDDAELIVAPPKPKEAKKNEVAIVIDRKGSEARRYSLLQHGPAFAELALGYAKKVGGKVQELH